MPTSLILLGVMSDKTPLCASSTHSFAIPIGAFNSWHVLHALSSSLSDHCPLLLEDAVGPRRLRTFKFENFWVYLPGFSEVVSNAWSEPSGHSQPFQALHYKLKKVGTPPLRVEPKAVVQRQNPSPVALWIILHLDIAQEQRPLSLAEVDLRSRLKRRVIFLAVLECAWK